MMTTPAPTSAPRPYAATSPVRPRDFAIALVGVVAAIAGGLSRVAADGQLGPGAGVELGRYTGGRI